MQVKARCSNCLDTARTFEVLESFEDDERIKPRLRTAGLVVDASCLFVFLTDPRKHMESCIDLKPGGSGMRILYGRYRPFDGLRRKGCFVFCSRCLLTNTHV